MGRLYQGSDECAEARVNAQPAEADDAERIIDFVGHLQHPFHEAAYSHGPAIAVRVVTLAMTPGAA